VRVKIRLSRHVRNNMKLYGILEADVAEAIQKPDSRDEESGKTVVLKRFSNRFSGFPLKVVYSAGFPLPRSIATGSGGEIFIITAYPLKKSRREA